MNRNWIAGCLGATGLALIGYASFSEPTPRSFGPDLALLETNPEDVEGETPLFAPPAADAVAGFAMPAAGGGLGGAPTLAGAPRIDAPAGEVGLFDSIPASHWLVEALEKVYPGGISRLDRGEVPGPITRYELAVVLARAFEAYRSQGGAGRTDPELLEKLGNELRGELGILGVEMAGLTRRVGEVAGRVSDLETGAGTQVRRTEELVKQVEELSRKLKQEEEGRLLLASRVEELSGKGDRLEERTKAQSEVLSRLVVKVAVADAGGRTPGSPADGEAVKQLGERVAKLEAAGTGGEGAAQFADRIQRLERLMIKVYRERSEAGGQTVDEGRLENLRRGMEELSRKVEGYRRDAANGARVDTAALDGVKNLMKGFLGDFEARLRKVESARF